MKSTRAFNLRSDANTTLEFEQRPIYEEIGLYNEANRRMMACVKSARSVFCLVSGLELVRRSDRAHLKSILRKRLSRKTFEHDRAQALWSESTEEV